MGGENDNLNWYELLTSQNEYDICDDRDVADMCNENRITKMDYSLGTRIYWICGFEVATKNLIRTRFFFFLDLDAIPVVYT